MNDQFIWLLKNSRLYKGIRRLLLGIRGERRLKVSPGLLLLNQQLNGIFNRYDVVVRLMAIEEIEAKVSGGLELYHKMQKSRNQYLSSIKKTIKKEDLYENRDGALQELVNSFKTKGFDPSNPISVNSNLKMVDGSHRLACALYFGSGEITVEKGEIAEIDYGLDWFKQHFLEDEWNLVLTRYKELLSSIDLNSILTEILQREKQVFGRGEFYQSFEEIGIQGQRPTAERYKVYNLENHLSKDLRVLDIGCNCGFFTLTIADKVKSALGIEITQTLVDIAQATQVYLRKENIAFQQGNFNNMNLDQRFDFICSFAVHHWLGADMRKYGKGLHDLLNPGGKVLLESQNINDQDKDWDDKLAKFTAAGFIEIESGQLKDDGVIERRFSVLQKH